MFNGENLYKICTLPYSYYSYVNRYENCVLFYRYYYDYNYGYDYIYTYKIIDSLTGRIIGETADYSNIISFDGKLAALEHTANQKYNYIFADGSKIENLSNRIIFYRDGRIAKEPNVGGEYEINGVNYGTVERISDYYSDMPDYFAATETVSYTRSIFDSSFNKLSGNDNVTGYSTISFNDYNILYYYYTEDEEIKYKIIKGGEVSAAFHGVSSLYAGYYYQNQNNRYVRIADKETADGETKFTYSVFDCETMSMTTYTGFDDVSLLFTPESIKYVENDDGVKEVKYNGTTFIVGTKIINGDDKNEKKTQALLYNLENGKQLTLFSESGDPQDEVIIKFNFDTIITHYYGGGEYRYNYYDMRSCKKIKSGAKDCPELYGDNYYSSSGYFFKGNELVRYTIINVNGLYGVTDGRGKILLNPVYTGIIPGGNGIFLIQKGLFAGLADLNGKVIKKADQSFVNRSDYRYLPFIMFADPNNSKLDIYNTDGSLLIKDADDAASVDRIGKSDHTYYTVMKGGVYSVFLYAPII